MADHESFHHSLLNHLQEIHWDYLLQNKIRALANHNNLEETFHTDVRSILAEARLRSSGALHPLQFFREEKIREALTKERGTKNIATGL